MFVITTSLKEGRLFCSEKRKTDFVIVKEDPFITPQITNKSIPSFADFFNPLIPLHT